MIKFKLEGGSLAKQNHVYSGVEYTKRHNEICKFFRIAPKSANMRVITIGYLFQAFWIRFDEKVASTGRAGCQSVECKKESVKIGKNELRLGTWVEFPDRGGSWRWRHWGCVTGKILLNIRQALDHTGSGEYCWEALDGYQGQDEKNSLDNYPDLQNKVRRVIKQGFIDPEDFKGVDFDFHSRKDND